MAAFGFLTKEGSLAPAVGATDGRREIPARVPVHTAFMLRKKFGHGGLL
jgi:hypothetical protein